VTEEVFDAHRTAQDAAAIRQEAADGQEALSVELRSMTERRVLQDEAQKRRGQARYDRAIRSAMEQRVLLAAAEVSGVRASAACPVRAAKAAALVADLWQHPDAQVIGFLRAEAGYASALRSFITPDFFDEKVAVESYTRWLESLICVIASNGVFWIEEGRFAEFCDHAERTTGERPRKL
jgi:hypothetical protein